VVRKLAAAWAWLATWHHLRQAATVLLGCLALGATVAAFGQSYWALVEWARNHHIPWPATWPLLVDSFMAMGEVRLFIAALDGKPQGSRWARCGGYWRGRGR